MNADVKDEFLFIFFLSSSVMGIKESDTANMQLEERYPLNVSKGFITGHF
jgi:hypothetical protein